MLIQDIKNKNHLHSFLIERGFISIIKFEKYSCESNGILNLRVIYKTHDWITVVKNDPNYIYHIIINTDFSKFIFHQFHTNLKLIYSNQKEYDESTLISLLDLINSIQYSNNDFINCQ